MIKMAMEDIVATSTHDVGGGITEIKEVSTQS